MTLKTTKEALSKCCNAPIKKIGWTLGETDYGCSKCGKKPTKEALGWEDKLAQIDKSLARSALSMDITSILAAKTKIAEKQEKILAFIDNLLSHQQQEIKKRIEGMKTKLKLSDVKKFKDSESWEKHVLIIEAKNQVLNDCKGNSL